MSLITNMLDSSKFFAISGVEVSSEYLKLLAKDINGDGETQHLTVDVINQERNVEVRRILILLFGGIQKFLAAGGAKVVKEPASADDYQDAKILELEIGSETFRYIMLINQTPDPRAKHMTSAQKLEAGLTHDGKKIYLEEFNRFLEAFPMMRDAVGAMWGLRPGIYLPDAES